MSQKELYCAAAILAICNMGMERPSRDTVQRALAGEQHTLDTFVMWFGQWYMENDEHYDTFMTEAEHWVQTLTKEPDWREESWKWVWHWLMKPELLIEDIIAQYWDRSPNDWVGREEGNPLRRHVMPEINAYHITGAITKVNDEAISFIWERGVKEGRAWWQVIGSYKGVTVMVGEGPLG